MQLVLEKNKERGHLPPASSYLKSPTGQLRLVHRVSISTWLVGHLDLFAILSTPDSMHRCVVNLTGQNSAAGTYLADPAAAEAGQVATGKEEW